jgi:hypothetical protein
MPGCFGVFQFLVEYFFGVVLCALVVSLIVLVGVVVLVPVDVLVVYVYDFDLLVLEALVECVGIGGVLNQVVLPMLDFELFGVGLPEQRGPLDVFLGDFHEGVVEIVVK